MRFQWSWPSYPIIILVALLSSVTVRGIAYGQRAAFTTPSRGSVVDNRRDFKVAVQIDNFESGGHYWVAIASVTGHAETWNRVLELYRQLRGGRDTSKAAELVKLIGRWQGDLFWPKFFVPESPYEGRVFDGGSNPLHGLEPQPMILLLLKVDDRLQAYFRNWLREGSAGKGYPGIPASRLGKAMILARAEIFFP